MIINLNLRDIGMGMVILGLILLLVFGLYTIMVSEIAFIIRISIVAIILGIVIALLSLIKENLESTDHFTERKY